jgi:hypothetical protein
MRATSRRDFRARLLIGVAGATGLAVVGLVVGLRGSPPSRTAAVPRIQGPTTAEVVAGTSPFPGTVRTTLDEAAKQSGRPAVAPNSELASPACMTFVWIGPEVGTGPPYEIVAAFSTGVVMYDYAPGDSPPPYETYVKEIGADASIVDIQGSISMAIQAGKGQADDVASVDFSVDGSRIALFGPISTDALVTLANSAGPTEGMTPVPCAH